MPWLQKDETLRASTEVRASADQIYSVVSDVTRIPEWSPETRRAEWLTPDRFRAWNRRRLGRWRTVANVVEAEPGRNFSFIVQALGGDWTHWTYLIEPGSTAGATRLTEVFRMLRSATFRRCGFRTSLPIHPGSSSRSPSKPRRLGGPDPRDQRGRGGWVRNS